MSFEERLTGTVCELISYAENKNLISHDDFFFYLNLFLGEYHIDAPAFPETKQLPGETVTKTLEKLCNLAVEKNMIEDFSYSRELFSTRLMGLLTPSPAEVRARFSEDISKGRPDIATDEFYQLCRNVDYIKTDAIAKNIRYFAETACGKLEITINLSKPEKDPREIAKLKNASAVGYPKCMLCVENSGYAGRNNFPARQNHRIIPLSLSGNRWYLQYSPYAYYAEHCIVFNKNHIPMKIDVGTFERMFSFVEQFPHYFIGSNADLPIVGGSILNHDHFQGGRYSFPMDHAGVLYHTTSASDSVQVSVLNWPMTTLCLEGSDQKAIIALADTILKAWRVWEDLSCDIIPFTGDTPHNTITPILRKIERKWRLFLVLRNNRTSADHPLGIFHPHAELHHIKRENIGLIEVMGLFILPGRLKTEIEHMLPYLTGSIDPMTINPDTDLFKHRDWILDLIRRYSIFSDQKEAEACIRQEIAVICNQVLTDAGVYKHTEKGMIGLARFLNTLGYEVEKR